MTARKCGGGSTSFGEQLEVSGAGIIMIRGDVSLAKFYLRTFNWVLQHDRGSYELGGSS